MIVHKPATLLPEIPPIVLTLCPNLVRPCMQPTIPPTIVLVDWMGWRAGITTLYPWPKVSIGPPKGVTLHDPTAMAQGNLQLVVDRSMREG